MQVELFIPCFVDQIFPETALNMVRILEKVGCTVNYNTEQTCCGQMAFNSGYWDETKVLGEKFIREFSTGNAVVTPSASCAAMVKNYYQDLFFNTGLHIEYKRLRSNIYEFTDFMVNVMGVTNLGAVFPHKVTYHDSCAALREYKLGDEPRILLKEVEGLQLIEMADRDSCCGFGGTFAVKHEGISSAMAEQKIDHALDTGAEYIISTDGSCLMHQDGFAKKNNKDIKTIHIIDVLASGW